jgi:hypothetical protein
MADPAKPKADPEPVTGELVKRKPSEIAAEIRRADLKRRIDLIEQNDFKLVHGMNRFSELASKWEPGEQERLVNLLQNGTKEELQAAGWKTRKDLRLAIYGTLPRSQIPYALQAAHERVGMRIRKEGASKRGGGPTILLNLPGPQAPRPEDKVIIVVKDPQK